jgi:hypothetical protein
MPSIFRKLCPELKELLTQFYNENYSDLVQSEDPDKKKKGFVLRFFIGAFPELINLSEERKQSYITAYKDSILQPHLDVLSNPYTAQMQGKTPNKKGGSKKKKQVYKNKSKKSKKLN